MSETAANRPPVAGWYPRPGAPEQLRYWDGQKWAPDADAETRNRALALAVGHQIAVGGVVAQRGDFSAIVTVLQPGDHINHLVHALLSILTCGLWLPVWIVIGVTAKTSRHATLRLDVDHQARVTITELK